MDIYLCPICGGVFDPTEHDTAECRDMRLLLLEEQEFLKMLSDNQKEVRDE